VPGTKDSPLRVPSIRIARIGPRRDLAEACRLAAQAGHCTRTRFAWPRRPHGGSGALHRYCLTAAFFWVVFFAGCGVAASARFNAHRRLVAATIAALPARLSFRLGLGAASAPNGSATFFDAAHLFRCASAMRARAAALIFLRRFRVGASGLATGPSSSMARSSAT
jgi:hypothetical protein